MEKALVAQRVANRLFATEKAVDAAMAEAASLMMSLAEARTELGLSAVVGDDATSKVAQAIATLAEARSSVVAAHGSLAETVLDRVIPLDDLVELGIRPLVERTARGKIIVDPQAA